MGKHDIKDRIVAASSDEFTENRIKDLESRLAFANETIKKLWKAGKIKKGDIIGFGNPGYHTMVFMGMNSKGYPIFNTMGHKRGLKVTYPSYAKRKVNMLVRIKKVR